MEQIEQCNCTICVRTRNYKKLLEKISDPSIAEWFNDFYSYVCELEEEIECYKIYQKNLRNLYPKIWNETTTIKLLERKDAEFPEKQL